MPIVSTSLPHHMWRPSARPARWWERYAPSPSRSRSEQILKRLIWVYWLLWLSEGALRKWLFPAFSGPLVLVRDPVALLILLVALAQWHWRLNIWTIVLWVMSLIGFASTIANQVSPWVGLVGLRTLGLHLPLVFVFANVLNRDDIERIGNLAIDLSMPMALLMLLQFRADPDSFINTGAGVDASQIGGVVDGKIRAPGVFSFISGAAQFYSLVAAYWFGKLGDMKVKLGFRMIFAGMGIAIAINVAISRSLAGAVAIVFIAFVVTVFKSGATFRKLASLAAMGAMCFGLVIGTRLLQEGGEALYLRFVSANDIEGSIVGRVLSSFIVPADIIKSAGVAGYGIGVGTNMGAALLGRRDEFLLAEAEWQRVVLEMGVILGFGFILWRIMLLFQIVGRAILEWGRGDILPILLIAAGGLTLVNGQTGQPATLGFLVISIGAAFGACNKPLTRIRPLPIQKKN